MKNDRNIPDPDAIPDAAMIQLIKAEITIEDITTIGGFLLMQAKAGIGEMDFAEHFAHQVFHQCKAQGFDPDEIHEGKVDPMIMTFSVPVVGVAAVGIVIQLSMEKIPQAECLKKPWTPFVRKATKFLEGETDEGRTFDAFGPENLN